MRLVKVQRPDNDGRSVRYHVEIPTLQNSNNVMIAASWFTADNLDFIRESLLLDAQVAILAVNMSS